jgi:UDP-2-acetamido-2,6-beta-L-arabino-hexul-4-ose reductase
MKVLITGAGGFIGRNLAAELRNRRYGEILEYSRETDSKLLASYTQVCDFVFHLAGIIRSQDPEAFMKGNAGFTGELLDSLKKYGNTCPVLFSSTIQAALPSPYGESKKACEELLFEYGRDTGAKVLVYRLPNIFGKWSRPVHNSVVSTFCYQVARGLPVRVDDRSSPVTLCYIDDLVQELLRALNGEETRCGDYCSVPVTYTKKLGDIIDLIYSFRECRNTLCIPDQADDFQRKLYSTYQSFLPAEALSYPLKMHADDRGFLSEILRTPDRGQVAVSVTKPGITRGRHWHHSKNEKFLVVSGRGRIELEQPGGAGTVMYEVSGGQMEIVEIPPGYVHFIRNTGETDLVTLIWTNECYDPDKPDTYFQES